MANKKTTKKVTTSGVGDMISKVTKALGIEECEGCKKRKELLNKLFPTSQAIEMTPDELTGFAEVKNKSVLTNDNLIFLQELYFKTFNLRRSTICRTCPPIWRTILDKLTKVYDIQMNNKDEDVTNNE